MTCGHCEKAVQTVDPDAQVAVNRPSGRVSVQSAKDAQAIRQAIGDEGYSVS